MAAIDDLINSAQSSTAPLLSRLPENSRAKYIADLAAVVAAEKEGKRIPSVLALTKYMMTEHGIKTTRQTVLAHLDILRNGGTLCR